ncbi:MAG: glycosyltransferase [Alicyclobacillus sp.]|nr:glycosyltransferase [Alicyclobacillus sp.]
MTTLKVLHVIESASGGSLQYVAEICNAVGGTGWEHIVIYSRRPDTPVDIRKVFQRDVRLIEMYMTREISFKVDLHSIQKLIAILRTLQPNILHLHSSKAGAIGRVAACLIRFKQPLIYTPHGFAFMRKDISWLKMKLYWLIEWTLCRLHSSYCLVGSEEEYRRAKEMYPARRLVKILNAVDVPQDPLCMEQVRECCIVTVGRITPAKNPDLVVDVLDELRKRVPNSKFVWVGDGELRAHFEQQCQSRGLQVTVTGWVDRNSVRSWLRQCAIYVQASAWEALPLALLEAMAMAKPVVVSDIVAHRDIIQPEVNGFIAKTAIQYAHIMEYLIANPEQARVIGLNAWSTVKKNYSHTRFVEELRTFYVECAVNSQS